MAGDIDDNELDEIAKKTIELQMRLQREVLGKGPGDSLPSSLSDAWFEEASQILEKVSNPDIEPDDVSADMATTLLSLLVLKILYDQGNMDAFTKGIPLEELSRYFEMYEAEFNLESLRRKGLIESAPATLENIFDMDRTIEGKLNVTPWWRPEGADGAELN